MITDLKLAGQYKMGNLATRRRRVDQIDTFTINANQARQLKKAAARNYQNEIDAAKAKAAAERQSLEEGAQRRAARLIGPILRDIEAAALKGENHLIHWICDDKNWTNRKEKKYLRDEVVRCLTELGFEVHSNIEDGRIIKLGITWE
jgi:hypothetical protein